MEVFPQVINVCDDSLIRCQESNRRFSWLRQKLILQSHRAACREEFLGRYIQNLHWKLGQQAPSFGSILSYLETIDLSIASTKTKYIKLNTKTQNIFCRLNENLTTFLYTLTGATRKQKEKKVFSFKVYTKVECY